MKKENDIVLIVVCNLSDGGFTYDLDTSGDGGETRCGDQRVYLLRSSKYGSEGCR